MGWNGTSPVGSQSVKDNRTIIQDNTTYIENTVGQDHFWNSGGTTDGHHKYMQTVATNIASTSVATNTLLQTQMNLVYYSRLKTPTEATTASAQTCQPYVKNAGSDVEATPFPLGVMQLLGIRAMGLFEVSIGNAVTVLYSHNILSISRPNEGVFPILFSVADPLPSPDYFVLGGAIGRSNQEIDFVLPAAVADDPTDFKSTTGLTIYTQQRATTTQLDPLQAWFVCFGG